jgi:hypothetical protein
MERDRPCHEALEPVGVDHDCQPRSGDCNKDEHIAELPMRLG